MAYKFTNFKALKTVKFLLLLAENELYGISLSPE